MAETARIPRSIPAFHNYMMDTDDYQTAGSPAAYKRWNWTDEESEAWTEFRNKTKPLFAKYSDKKVGRTTVIKDDLLLIIKDCVKYDREHHLLDRIASSSQGIVTDYSTFHIKRGTPLAKPKGTRRVEPIAEQCVAILTMMGGGFVRVRCRTHHNNKRPAKAKGADSIIAAWRISETAPAHADDGTTKEVSTKATFTIHCGEDSPGKKLHLYTRWYDTKNPNRAGPWTGPKSNWII